MAARGGSGPRGSGWFVGVVGLGVLVVLSATVILLAAFAGGAPEAGDPWAGLGWLVLLAAIAATVALNIWFTRRRRARLRAWAAALGWTYADADPSLTRRWTGDPFGVGSARRSTEVIRGLYRGRPVTSFTYRWTTGSGKNRTTHTRHVVALDLPAAFPRLELTPENLATRLVRALGGQDIRFESDEFNRAWRVQSPDLRLAHGVIHPRMMERLLQPDLASQPLRIDGPAVVSWLPGATDTDGILPRVAALCDVADAIPRHVWQDHGYDPMTAARSEEQP